MLLVNARFINWSAFFFAVLQSACSAFIALNGARLLIGVGAFAAASGRAEAGGPHTHRRDPHSHDASRVGWLSAESGCSLASLEAAETPRVGLASKVRTEEKK